MSDYCDVTVYTTIDISLSIILHDFTVQLPHRKLLLNILFVVFLRASDFLVQSEAKVRVHIYGEDRLMKLNTLMEY